MELEQRVKELEEVVIDLQLKFYELTVHLAEAITIMADLEEEDHGS